MIVAGFSSILKSYQGKVILRGASGAVKEGERIALLGVNGSGKTTLLDILAGLIDCDSGSVDIPNAVRKGYLPQTIEITSGGPLFNYVLEGLGDLISMHSRLDELHNLLEVRHDEPLLLKELGNLQDKFDKAGGYDMETKAHEVLNGLGFDPEDHQMDIRTLSGGQRNRAALARTLIGKPDLLLLDEPTNHLDISGLEFLENHLNSFRGGVIFVSHDRAFIHKAATTIWEMVAGRIISYPGTYENYLTEREKRLESMHKAFESQKEFIEKTEDFIRRNIAGQKTKQAQSRRQMLKKIERLERPGGTDEINGIRFAGAERSARIVIKCKQTDFSYDGTPFLKNLDFEIERGDRIGLVGPNGSGKTTIIRLIMGQLEPTIGQVYLGKKLTTGYYDQLAENLKQDSTPLATIYDIKREWNEGQVRGYLAKFLFRGDDVFRRIDSFSGGEQSRLALAKLIVGEPNFLVLDEPTNHLDIQSREALEEALSTYSGTVLCVSHDRYFLDVFADKIFALENDEVKIYLGNYSEYREKYLQLNQQPAPTVRRIKSTPLPPPRKKDKRTNPQVIEKLESDISRIEINLNEIENTLANTENSSDWQKLSSLLNERDRLYAELEELYQKRQDIDLPQ